MSEISIQIAVILSKKYIFMCKRSHVQYACNVFAKFQTECLKTLREADYTNLLPHT